MYKINRSKSFIKIAKKFFKKHNDKKDKFKELISKLEFDPFNPSLNTHKLKGKLKDFYACSLDYEYRIILSIVIIDDVVYLVDIGKHSDVY